MTDVELVREFCAFGPGAAARARMARRLDQDLEAAHSSLFEEWLGLLRVRPLVTLGFATAAACTLLFTSPLGALSLALLN
jgi:hypothetical protein